jgi:hypothetical protein
MFPTSGASSLSALARNLAARSAPYVEFHGRFLTPAVVGRQDGTRRRVGAKRRVPVPRSFPARGRFRTKL